MGFTDGLYFGQCKLICTSKNSSDAGKTVTVSQGTKTWTDTLSSDLKCTISLPQKGIYTATLGTYSTEVPMSYGEVKEVILTEGYDSITEGDIKSYTEISNGESGVASAEAVKTVIDNVATVAYTADKAKDQYTFLTFYYVIDAMSGQSSVQKFITFDYSAEELSGTYSLEMVWATSSGFTINPTSWTIDSSSKIITINTQIFNAWSDTSAAFVGSATITCLLKKR